MKPFTPPRQVVLTGAHVRLEPLARSHAEDLYRCGRDPAIWEYLPHPPLRDLDDTRAWIDRALDAVTVGSQAAFAIIHLESSRAVGSTRYLDIRPADRAVEIGWTWVAPPFQRTAVNTECKLLLLRHAFEELGAIRVQLKTDGRNRRSQQAIERLGAVREGVLRRHMVLCNGFVRDTVYFSILDAEWPAVQAKLQAALEASPGSRRSREERPRS